jgi:hypothetical protein
VLGDRSLPGSWKYGEFQTSCSSKQLASKTCFDKPDTIELFDLIEDEFELHNVAGLANYSAVVSQLHARVHKWYSCVGVSCP